MKHVVVAGALGVLLFAGSIVIFGEVWIASIFADEPVKNNVVDWSRTEPIDTSAGKVVGRTNGSVTAFLGLRYAQPPIGNQRFMPPVASPPWEGVFEATEYANMSMQVEAPAILGGANAPGMSEDSLFLNVYTPAAQGSNRPVLFWIHGGSFTQGSAGDYDGSTLAEQGDVVVVVINYRLGIFGFLDLSGSGDALSGSASNGIRDQILALEWVRDNIADYGGDADNVTIFGESAGGASVLSILSSPSANGLYHKAIAHSGGHVNLPPEDFSEKLTRHLSVDVDGLPHTLRDLSAEDLLAVQKKIQFGGGGNIDGTVITRSARRALLERGASGVPLIVGSNKDEGALFSFILPWFIYGPIGEAVATSTTGGEDPADYLSKLKAGHPEDGRKEHFERICFGATL